MNKARIRSTLLAIVGALAVVGPQLLNLIGTWKSPKAALAASIVGFIVALVLNGKAVALINLLFPAPVEPAPAAKAEVIDISTPKPAA